MKKINQEPSIASINKRGEGKDWLLVAVGMILLALIGTLVFFLISMSTSTRDAVLDQQKQYELTNNIVTKGLFSIISLRFENSETASCTMGDNFQQKVLLTLRFKAYEIPDTCSFFVNGKILPNIENKISPADCKGACNFEEFNRQFSLGYFDYRDSHTIRVCCNAICNEHQLDSLCGIDATANRFTS